jgi:hypothetical protein
MSNLTGEYPHRWQYSAGTDVIKWNHAVDWCHQHLEPGSVDISGWGYIHFKNSADYTAFALRWV